MMSPRLGLVASVSLAMMLFACGGDDSESGGPGSDGGSDASDAGADHTAPDAGHDATPDAPHDGTVPDAAGDDGGVDAADTGTPVDAGDDSASDASDDAADAADADTTHSVCVPGAKVDPGTDACAAEVCDLGHGADPYCCTTAWDLNCAEVAFAVCASTCPSDPADAGVASFGGTSHAMAQLASRDDALCAVSVEGEVWCWGAENALGDGAEQHVYFPRRMLGAPVPTKSIAMAQNAVCALGTDDALRCWGLFPVASDNPTSPVLTPPASALVTDVAGAAGDRGLLMDNAFMCAATKLGHVQCWGKTTANLGPGVAPPTTIPTPVDLSATTVGSNVSAVFAGGGATCVLVGSGTPLCWGENTSGMLGHQGMGTAAGATLACLPASGADGGPDDCANALGGVSKVAIGASSVCVLDANSAVRCLGSDANGALGAGLDGGAFATPQTVSGVTAADIAVGKSHACAAPADAAAPVSCWGSNATGQLGDAFDGGASSVPVAIPSLTGVKQIVAWSGGNCALKTDGTVWCWGADTQGQLARGVGTGGSPSPTPVQIPFRTYP